MKYDYDLFVIGAGSGGVRAARMSAGFGARVAIAEERYLGGTCVNVGCVPKKLFVYGSHFSEDFDDARSYGWDVSTNGVSWSTLRDNKTKEIHRLNGIYRSMLENAGVKIYADHAAFLDEHTLQVGNNQVSADRILVATGSWPHIPEFPGSHLAVSSNEMFYLPRLPNRLAIVGGGYIAVEFAGIMNGLGVETSLIYRGPLFLRGFDLGIRQFVRRELEQKGVNLIFDETVEEIRQDGNAKSLALGSGSSLEVDEVMYATGRRAMTTGLDLENASVGLNQAGTIEIDGSFRTSTPNIYALGDVIDRVQLTPVAIAEGMAFAYSTFGSQSRDVDYSAIPTSVFCQPNIGTVGPTEEEAKEKYLNLEVFESSFRPMKHTLTGKAEKSYMKLLVDGASDRVVAAHMVGPEAGEIIQGIAVAITAKATKADFDRTIAIHPTSAEEFVTMRERTR